MAEKADKETVQMAEASLTNEALREWENRIGLSLRVSNIFNSTVSFEAIRNYANGIGDANPLYHDIEYGKGTRYGAMAPPPSWAYSVFPTWVLQGLPGLHADHSANEWRFYRPIYINDKITPESYFIGYDVKPSRFAGKTVFEYQKADYRNQRGELVASAYTMLVRYERQTAKKTGKYDAIKLPHPWTEEELAKVDEDVLAEEIRGAKPRYWEDVDIGDELQPVVKGPFGQTDMIAYCVGAAPVVIAAHGAQLRNYQKHPAWAFRDPVDHAWEPVYGVHYLNSAARAAGAIYAYDAGAQRQGFLIHLITNWMGDDGWLKKNYAEYRQFFYHSDVLWLKGKVVKKYTDEDGDYCVDIETSAINQRGVNTMPGYSTVALPSRDNNIWPLAKRVRQEKPE